MSTRTLPLLAALGIAACTVTCLAPAASALGGESLACQISPGSQPGFSQNCRNSGPASQYAVVFQVQNETAPATYSWSVPVAYQSEVTSGCTSTVNYCGITTGNADAHISVSVTLTQGSVSETLNSSATINRYCGAHPC